MTDEEKLTMLKSLVDDSEVSDSRLNTYLSLAKDVVIHKCYPFLEDYSSLSVPDKYGTIQVRIANELFQKEGAEGQIRMDEDGVTRIYESASISSSLLAEIVPFGKVFG